MRRVPVLFLGAGLVAAGGCNSVIGLDNFHVTHNAAGGAGGAPACGEGLTMNQKIIQTCVLRASCSPFVPNARISDCITLNLQQAFIGTACTSAATNCNEVALCQGYGFTTAQQCSGQTGWRCENNNAINCTQNYFINCTKMGGQCQMYDSNNDSVPDTADCKVVDSCTSGQTGCQQDALYNCVGGVGYGMKCSQFGAQCSMLSGQPACLLATQTCSGTLPACANGSAQVCINGLKTTFDCSSVGLDCKSDPTNGPYCTAPGCTLTQATSCGESCTGSTAHLCYGGVPFDVDCTKYGFTKCVGHNDKAPPQGIGHFVVCAN